MISRRRFVQVVAALAVAPWAKPAPVPVPVPKPKLAANFRRQFLDAYREKRDPDMFLSGFFKINN